MALDISLSRPRHGAATLAALAEMDDLGIGDEFRWPINTLGMLAQQTLMETTEVHDAASRRPGKSRVPASSLQAVDPRWRYTGLAETPPRWRYTGLAEQALAGPRWPVNPLAGGDGSTAARDWAGRRMGKTALPASSFRGLGNDGTAVRDWRGRRMGKTALPASSLRAMETRRLGFAAFDSLDMNVSVREAQILARKIGICGAPGYHGSSQSTLLVVDGLYGPQTANALLLATNAAPGAAAIPPTERFAGEPNARQMRFSGPAWAALNAHAAGRTDGCSGSVLPSVREDREQENIPQGGGEAQQASMMSSPWVWGIGVLAVLGVGWYVMSESEEAY